MTEANQDLVLPNNPKLLRIIFPNDEHKLRKALFSLINEITKNEINSRKHITRFTVTRKVKIK